MIFRSKIRKICNYVVAICASENALRCYALSSLTYKTSYNANTVTSGHLLVCLSYFEKHFSDITRCLAGTMFSLTSDDLNILNNCLVPAITTFINLTKHSAAGVPKLHWSLYDV